MTKIRSESLNVSVIIPTFQRAHMISLAIDSVLNQTYQDFEIIVVDDGSMDGTREVVMGYREKVKYIYQENRGPASARNTGIRATRGDLIAFQDSDDLWLPEKLASQVSLFEQDPELGFVYCDMSYFRSDGPSERPSSFKSHAPPLSGYAFRDMFVQGTPMHTPTAVIRLQCLQKVGLFDETMRYFEDQDLWFRLARICKMGYVEKPLVRCRLRDQKKRYKEDYLFRKNILKSAPWLRNELSKDELYQGYYIRTYLAALSYLAVGETRQARDVLAECLKFNPFWFKAYLVWLGTFHPKFFIWAKKVLRNDDLISRFAT
ncbi:glycosyltransferase family 2 protein [Thermodesulfobacteriota bacterium]